MKAAALWRFATCARSTLLMSTSFVSRIMTTEYPRASSSSRRASATCRLSSYSSTPENTPDVPDDTFACVTSAPGPIGSLPAFPLI